MNILVAGGSGFLGHPLCTALVDGGHGVTVLSRRPERVRSAPEVELLAWDPAHSGPDSAWVQRLREMDAVINLAGENLAGGGPLPSRWSPGAKAKLRTSRLQSTRVVVQALGSTPPERRPHVMINASAIGYYGDRGDEILTEASSAGTDFLATLCADWEAAAVEAEPLGVRVVRLRTGVVLDRGGMAADLLTLASWLGVGGRLGSGRQWWSWIHRADVIGLILHALHTEPLHGAFNAVGPAPRRMADFPRVLGQLLTRPSFMPAPSFALRLAFGEVADALLLASQRVLPNLAEETGYEFHYATLEQALQAIVTSQPGVPWPKLPVRKVRR
ncbi:MAG: TIGR01777 family oxidoreductase [Chloroflexi bacterium]|nr:TIGR01777 family oxidoreductase [Chloroflexota bacterium]